MPIEVHHDLTWSDYEDMDCPLCMEHFDFDEVNFFPCSCGYQVCKFCWDRISHQDDTSTRVCPACRAPYTDQPALAAPISEELREKLDIASKGGVMKPVGGGAVGAPINYEGQDRTRIGNVTDSRKHLSTVRVLQKNLVFIVGLSPSLAKEDILKKYEYFGKYGTIKKVAISTNHSNYYAGNMASASAYLTFSNSDDALRAIIGGNGQYCDGRTLKCSLGTTKYCSRYLRNQDCTLQECMYLHDIADQEASFTKIEMNSGKHTEYENELLEGFKRREQEKTARHLGKVLSQKLAPKPKKQTSTTVTAPPPALPVLNRQTSQPNTGDSSPVAKKRSSAENNENGAGNPWVSSKPTGVSPSLKLEQARLVTPDNDGADDHLDAMFNGGMDQTSGVIQNMVTSIHSVDQNDEMDNFQNSFADSGQNAARTNIQNNIQNNLQNNGQNNHQNSVQNNVQNNVQNVQNNGLNNVQNNMMDGLQNNYDQDISQNHQFNEQISSQHINQHINQQIKHQINSPYTTEIQPDTPEDGNFQFTNFTIHQESRVTGQTLNLKYNEQQYSENQTDEEELATRWNNIVNTLKSTDGLKNIGANSASSLRDKLLHLGSEIVPVQCICSRRMRPRISEMFCRQQELQRQQQLPSNDYQQYNEYSRRYTGPTTADWSNQASSAQSSGWGYNAGNGQAIAPPGLMRGAM